MSDLAPGSEFAGHRIEEVVGHGGMGVVYRAVHVALGRTVALKILAQMSGLYATFLPKPIRGMSGSGMHVHQSLSYKANGSNAFADPGDFRF